VSDYHRAARATARIGPRRRLFSAIPAIEARVLDFLALFRRKGGRQRRNPLPGARRSIVGQSVNGPMFSNRVEPMSQPRGQPHHRPDQVRPDQARHDRDWQDQVSQDQVSQDYVSQDYVSQDRSRPDPHPDSDRQDQDWQQPERRQQERPQPARPQQDQPRHRQPDQPRDGNAWQPQTHGFLAAHGVERSFVGRKVVKGVSLYVRRGEAVGLLGPNGAGKTTVFYMITGLITADRGRIELDGHDVTSLPMYQRARLGIGYLPQEASIFRGLTVEENIRAVLEVVEPNKRRRQHDLDSLLEEFNITRLRKTPSIALSGGERRRVEIARALASRPNYMLLDEPFAGIDPIAVGDIQALVRHLTQRGIGVLITDHNVRETLGLTDRAYIIYSGEVLMEGRADDIVNNPDVRRLYLGEEFRM
jgi:lipopolysaccharide export system ATP-binding protein